MSKILVVGDGSISKQVIKSLAVLYGGGRFGQGKVVQGEPLTAGQMPRVAKEMILTNENEWRGGSRGKGGKTKWPIRK